MQEIVFEASAFFKEIIEFQNSIQDWVSAGRYCHRNYETLSLAPARLFNSFKLWTSSYRKAHIRKRQNTLWQIPLSKKSQGLFPLMQKDSVAHICHSVTLFSCCYILLPIVFLTKAVLTFKIKLVQIKMFTDLATPMFSLFVILFHWFTHIISL